MPFWPFKRKPQEPLTPAGVRDRLIEAAASQADSGLRALCEKYKGQVAANLDLMSKAPAGMPTDPASLDRYIRCLLRVAECLANECAAPELLKKLQGTPDDNPLLQWDHWYGELAARMERLEHAVLIAEAKAFIERARALQGHAARQNEAFLLGRLGELLFHSGQVRDAEGPFRAALTLCQEINDGEGQRVYLNNLLEVYRYLGDAAEAVRTGEHLVSLSRQHGLNCDALVKQVALIRRGEPPCRVVCVRGGEQRELDELAHPGDGHFEFHFRRNRLQLQMAVVLAGQGRKLASSGNLADALEKFQQAAEIDPQDPDPVYQSGVCLLELGAYGKAREAFEEVERLAPGWFICRTCRWLAASLEDGSVTDEEYRVWRALDGGGLPPDEAFRMAQQAVRTYPNFAPHYLILGDLYRNRGENERAVACYKNGLEFVQEPDLESRLLCAIAGLLAKEEPERGELFRRAVSLKGNLVAQATAALVGIL